MKKNLILSHLTKKNLILSHLMKKKSDSVSFHQKKSDSVSSHQKKSDSVSFHQKKISSHSDSDLRQNQTRTGNPDSCDQSRYINSQLIIMLSILMHIIFSQMTQHNTT